MWYLVRTGWTLVITVVKSGSIVVDGFVCVPYCCEVLVGLLGLLYRFI